MYVSIESPKCNPQSKQKIPQSKIKQQQTFLRDAVNKGRNGNKQQQQQRSETRSLLLEMVNVALLVHILFGYYARAYLNIVFFLD